ncbi:MAG TPA: DNA photolyase [Chromatiales bacterium]|nr:DNA photolyase [Chromatiales bacterium]
MIDHIYIESGLREHPRVVEIKQRYTSATIVECDRYGEVFNPKAQNFRLQKSRPALILADKPKGRVQQAPAGYGIGGDHHYYFSHMLNCLYDCRYCFLQGMYRSAHYVLFVNYEDFMRDIRTTLAAHPGEDVWFYSGYDCDSLALEPVSRFCDYFLPEFAGLPHAKLELRTKSTQVRGLLKQPAMDNVVVAFSFTPQEVSAALEHKVPSVQKRLDAMLQLQRAGWQLGLRFDPVIYSDNFKQQYRELFAQVFATLDVALLHSVSIGAFRLPKQFFKTLVRLHPHEALFAGPLREEGGMVSYQQSLGTEMIDFCTEELARYIPQALLFPCDYAA